MAERQCHIFRRIGNIVMNDNWQRCLKPQNVTRPFLGDFLAEDGFADDIRKFQCPQRWDMRRVGGKEIEHRLGVSG